MGVHIYCGGIGGVIMFLDVKLDMDQVHDIVIASLKEYYEYLSKTTWDDNDELRAKTKDAFELVLEQYMRPSEYKEYIASFIN